MTPEQSVARNRKALETAREKGRQAARDGLGRHRCPYSPTHDFANGRAIGSVWYRHWMKGWREVMDGKADVSP